MLVAMRWVFALLLLGNIVLFALMQLPRDKANSETMASHTPYHAENIRLLGEEEVASLPPPATPLVCLEWGLFTDQELAQARTGLKELKLEDGDVSVQTAPPKANTWWVYIPPQKSKQEANKKVEELKSLGIPDSFVMQDNNQWRYAVSLGVFSTQAAAEKYLAQSREKGVRSAKASARNPDGNHSSMIIKTSGAKIEAELVKLKQDFPASELKAVPCPE